MKYPKREYVLLFHYLRSAASLLKLLLFVSSCLNKQQVLNCPSELGRAIFHFWIKGETELILRLLIPQYSVIPLFGFGPHPEWKIQRLQNGVCLANLFLGILQKHLLLRVYWRFSSPNSMTFLCISKERHTVPCRSPQKFDQEAIPGKD